MSRDSDCIRAPVVVGAVVLMVVVGDLLLLPFRTLI